MLLILCRRRAIRADRPCPAQLLNVTFWMVPNIYLLAVTCGFFSRVINVATFIRMTCWNTVRAHTRRPPSWAS